MRISTTLDPSKIFGPRETVEQVDGLLVLTGSSFREPRPGGLADASESPLDGRGGGEEHGVLSALVDDAVETVRQLRGVPEEVISHHVVGEALRDEVMDVPGEAQERYDDDREHRLHPLGGDPPDH